MIKAIFFDLDDTLLWDQKSIKDSFVATCKLAEERYGIDHIQLEEKVRDAAKSLYSSYNTYLFTQMIGINPFEGLWGDFLDEKKEFQEMKEIVPTYRKDTWTNGLIAMGIDDRDFGCKLAEYFPQERRKTQFVYDETFHVLDALKDKYKLLLLTNGSPDLQNTKLTITPELVPYFEKIVISGDFGKGKPDPTIFEYALKEMSLNNDEVIMVGDNLMTDILGANQAGITSVWINRENKERNEVKPTFEINHLEQLLQILETLK